ncbi:acyltransferase family protein [Nonomuraea africana]|uniref:Peptidoglycan/LPS O-acetylase OafA/YrhL n=1 Tax=Nonomuraea africana TaxID=46171 RepID=A0ABR9KH22_9ACTN|nr:acyltransferase [Nonomuraea africana]MBE1561324.1 peptidoglycan/LPS O-acetylase OafA/YrhL [Nonomuraea africana]
MSRLAWLDALRGIGAVAVLAEHMLPWVIPSLRPYWFNLGMYGVLVFFLVSGYIIPTSLERRGDVGGFWVGRVFRLYPLYLTVIALVMATSWWMPIRQEVPRDSSSIATHATMLQDVLGTGAVVDTMWTLSYEMVFYLLVTTLFVIGVHRRSGSIAIGFGVAAVASGLLMAAAPIAPGAWPSWLSFAVFFAGLACLITGRFRTAATYVLGAGALALLILSSRVPWFGLAILAVMFAGTAIQRWERGEGPLWPVGVTAVLVALSPAWAIHAGWWWVRPGVWITTILLAAVTFAMAMALRHRGTFRFLAWLGMVSYSVYLLHHPLLKYFVAITGDLRRSPLAIQALMGTLFVGLVLGASWLTYRFVEIPMQRLGRHLTTRQT